MHLYKYICTQCKCTYENTFALIPSTCALVSVHIRVCMQFSVCLKSTVLFRRPQYNAQTMGKKWKANHIHTYFCHHSFFYFQNRIWMLFFFEVNNNNNNKMNRFPCNKVNHKLYNKIISTISYMLRKNQNIALSLLKKQASF